MMKSAQATIDKQRAQYSSLIEGIGILARFAAEDDFEGIPEETHLEQNRELYQEVEGLERLVADWFRGSLDDRITEVTQTAYSERLEELRSNS